jgi:hypothetical protein
METDATGDTKIVGNDGTSFEKQMNGDIGLAYVEYQR